VHKVRTPQAKLFRGYEPGTAHQRMQKLHTRDLDELQQTVLCINPLWILSLHHYLSQQTRIYHYGHRQLQQNHHCTDFIPHFLLSEIISNYVCLFNFSASETFSEDCGGGDGGEGEGAVLRFCSCALPMKPKQ
jgi:hypothetical protein